LSKKDTKGENAQSKILCKKVPDTKKYFVSFALSKKDSSLNQEVWTLNKLIIKKGPDDLH
jgi:hypothetical protein